MSRFIPEKVLIVDEENFEELSVRAACGPEALFFYFEWAKMTDRKVLVDSYGDIHWRPSMAWPDPPILKELDSG